MKTVGFTRSDEGDAFFQNKTERSIPQEILGVFPFDVLHEIDQGVHSGFGLERKKTPKDQMSKLGDPLDMFEHAYEEMPPYLKEQREELIEELAADREEGHHG